LPHDVNVTAFAASITNLSLCSYKSPECTRRYIYQNRLQTGWPTELHKLVKLRCAYDVLVSQKSNILGINWLWEDVNHELQKSDIMLNCIQVKCCTLFRGYWMQQFSFSTFLANSATSSKITDTICKKNNDRESVSKSDDKRFIIQNRSWIK